MANRIKMSRVFFAGGTAFQALALLGAGLGVAAVAVPAAAQDYTNVTASGKVQGTDGKAIAGATVQVTSNQQGFSRSAVTSSDGSYVIPQLPIGGYTFSITADGYTTFNDNDVYLAQNQAGNTFTLASADASMSRDIVVTAGRRKVADFDQTTTGAVINVSDLATRVPVARDLTSVIRLAPGTQSGDSAFGNLPSIAGSSVGENQYYVNGLDITNFRTFLGSNSVPFEFYDTIDVKNGGYQAEFGRATGGVVVATTKSGSNTFHAGVVVTYQPNGLMSKSPDTEFQDNDNDYRSDLRSDFYISGPIIKDHLFFYGLYESRDVSTGDGTTALGGSTYTRTSTTSPFFAGKVDAVITDGQRLEGTFFRTTGQEYYDYFNYNPATNMIGGYQSSQLYKYGGNNYVGRYTGTFTKWLTVSAAYGRSNDRTDTGSNTPNLPSVFDFINGTGGLLSGTNSVTSQTQANDRREFYRGDVDLYAKFFGSHHFRFGYDRENLSTIDVSNYTGGAYYSIFNDPTVGNYVARRTFTDGGTFTSENEAFYAEDSWALFQNRLTLQLGVRDDRFTNKNAAGVPFYKSGNQFAPRVGFTFDVTGTGRTKLYGSFGRYFLPVAANTNLRLAGSEYDVTDYFQYLGQNSSNVPVLGNPLNNFNFGSGTTGACLLNANTNCRVVSDGTVQPTATTVASNLQPQSADEYILGGEQRLGHYWKVGAYLTFRKLNQVLEDSAIDAAAIKYCNAHGLSCASLYTGFSQYVLNNPGRTMDVTLLDGTKAVLTPDMLGYPQAKRTYKALTLTVDRSFDNRWSFSGSYTLSYLKGNYEGGVDSDIGQADTGLTEDFDQPGFENGAYGYLPNDHRHNIKLYGSYKFFDWLVLGANASFLSPRHFGCNGVVPNSVDPYAGAYGVGIGNYCRFANGSVSNSNPVVLVPRGSALDSDWDNEIDLTAQIKLPTTAFDGSLRFDVFNVLNSKGALELNQAGGIADANLSASKDYGVPVTYQAPRYARIQLQLRF